MDETLLSTENESIVSKEDTEIDIIKDFLKMRGYKNALEGLEKDDYKTVEKKKVY